MKIIKTGKIKDSTKITCGYCESILEYNSTDIKRDFRDGDYIICPICGKFLSVGEQPTQTDRRTDC